MTTSAFRHLGHALRAAPSVANVIASLCPVARSNFGPRSSMTCCIAMALNTLSSAASAAMPITSRNMNPSVLRLQVNAFSFHPPVGLPILGPNESVAKSPKQGHSDPLAKSPWFCWCPGMLPLLRSTIRARRRSRSSRSSLTNLTEAPLISHLIRSIISRGLFLQTQRGAQRRALYRRSHGAVGSRASCWGARLEGVMAQRADRAHLPALSPLSPGSRTSLRRRICVHRMR